MTGKRPEPVDVIVGGNIRIQRLALRMSQGKLGKAIGVTFQQVQKYEKGANRVGASKLMLISKVLNVPVSTFFEGAKGSIHSDNGIETSPTALLSERDALRIVKAFTKIEDTKLRRLLTNLVENLVPESSSDR